MQRFRDIIKVIINKFTPEELKVVQREVGESKSYKEFVGVCDISEKGVKFIAAKEGFASHMYNDIAEHCTIGYGHLIHHGPIDGQISEKPFKKGLTKQQALKLLKQKLQRYIVAVNRGLQIPQNQVQFDALVAFTYNIGTSGFLASSCLRLINKKASIKKIEARWKVWNKIRDPKTWQKVVAVGLINRRKWEWDLYSQGKYGWLTVSTIN